MRALGDFIDGAFVEPEGEPLVSRNPARESAVVFETQWTASRIDMACTAAAQASRSWSKLSRGQRWEALVGFREALRARAREIADAIMQETGKLASEARGEVTSLLNRFEMVRARAEEDMAEGTLAGHPSEALRLQPLGVVGVIGPFNYPLHLCHAHVIPALLMGNAVVMKPSDVAPLAAQCYAAAARDSGLPAGVLNVVQGAGTAGARLVANAAVRGICFTGSYRAGRAILAQALDRPELLVALEMGGKNTAIVLSDASIRQAAHEIVVGGYLTTGQRCTATDRVLVERSCADALMDAVRTLVASLRFGDPEDGASFAGPLSTEGGRERFEAAIRAARDGGAEAVVAGGRQPGGLFLAASLHKLPDGVHDIVGYTDTELFGPDVGVEIIEDREEAVQVLGASPYGFANSVFSASEEHFEYIYRHTHAGILNRNRSTNLASPRLPFGGAGRSGNYRPAGAYALRNVVLPMAVQQNPLDAMVVHKALERHLPAPDLDALAARQQADEAREAGRRLIDEPRPMGPRAPMDGRMPQSDAWLERLYAGGRVVREKKPAVFDHLRSAGPWFVSIDDEPLSVLDGMSQTATLSMGFAADSIVSAYIEGQFGETLQTNRDTGFIECASAVAMADTLRALVPGLPEVAYANSGAEANEKALALCHLDSAQRRTQAQDQDQDQIQANRVLAFEGSFHGRTLLALHATYNPAKRGPFEVPGYEATFAPFPLWSAPNESEPAAPEGFYAAMLHGDGNTLGEHLLERFVDGRRDGLLEAEVRSLTAVHEALSTGAYFACIIEPMQCEGGDRYATARFFRALRLLTRRHGVNLIFDEVQTGFGLGGPFAWHASFDLIDGRGQRDYPDAVTFAKRAQLGVVMSRFVDPEPTATQTASLVRGRLHAESSAPAGEASATARFDGGAIRGGNEDAARVEAAVAPRLAALAQAYPHLMSAPRYRGYALAFDLPTPAYLAAYLGQRFWRGAIVYGAGSRTVRYRLSQSYGSREIEMLFTTMRRSLSWLDAHPGATPPAWENQRMSLSPPSPLSGSSGSSGLSAASATLATSAADEGAGGLRFRIRSPREGEAPSLLLAMLELERSIYEPARRGSVEELQMALDDPDGITLIAEVRGPGSDSEAAGGSGDGGDGAQADGGWQLAGFALAVPLERVAEVDGPAQDTMLGKRNTLYALSTTVDASVRGHGIGRALKVEQLRRASEQKDGQGALRYRYLSGRNRIGHTAQMDHLNRAYGAHVVALLHGQYGDPEGCANYYRIPLGSLAPMPADEARATEVPADGPLDGSGGIARPFADPPPSLRAAEDDGLLYGPAVNKITIMNFATPATVRALEWVSSLMPQLPRLYLTSSRDECIDKALRIMRWHRKQSCVAIGMDGGYVGHTTAAARSLSDPGVHRQGAPYFAWPRVPHPAVVGVEATCAAVRHAIEEAGGGERVFALVFEWLQERTGHVIPQEFWSAIDDVRQAYDVPLMLLETATASYRSGRGAFACEHLLAKPDIIGWWSGAQTGYLHVSDRYAVSKPLTMVSTWDGDELSLVRQHHHLRAARNMELQAAIVALDEVADALGRAALPMRGLGLYRVIDAGQRATEVVDAALAHGLRLRAFANGALAVAPALDRAIETAHALKKVAAMLTGD